MGEAAAAQAQAQAEAQAAAEAAAAQAAEQASQIKESKGSEAEAEGGDAEDEGEASSLRSIIGNELRAPTDMCDIRHHPASQLMWYEVAKYHGLFALLSLCSVASQPQTMGLWLTVLGLN